MGEEYREMAEYREMGAEEFAMVDDRKQRDANDELERERRLHRSAKDQWRARERELEECLANCVHAMTLWGSWEDGVPESGPGEHGFVGNAYDRAKMVLAMAETNGERIGAIVKRADQVAALTAERDALRSELAAERDMSQLRISHYRDAVEAQQARTADCIERGDHVRGGGEA